MEMCKLWLRSQKRNSLCAFLTVPEVLPDFHEIQTSMPPAGTVDLEKIDLADTLIPEQARKKRAKPVVMGTVARTGLPGLFVGNTAERILTQLDCSVLAVKPEGFVTPVELE